MRPDPEETLRSGGEVALPDLLFQQSERIAVLGIGNELNGDDAAGVLVARRLKELLAEQPVVRSVVVYEAATAPENFTGPLRRFAPHLILMVDAAHLEAEAGTVAWIDWQQTDGVSASTHGLPPTVLAKYMMSEFGCRVALVGIQPAHLDFDCPVTPAVLTAVEQLSQLLASLLGRRMTEGRIE